MPDMQEPDLPRAVTFFDTQNFYRMTKAIFPGITHPNFDPVKLSNLVCKKKGWQLCETRLYTGVPDKKTNVFWNAFWNNKISALKRSGVICYTRPLVNHKTTRKLPDGTEETITVPAEKGIDVRIALDIISMANKNLYDVAILFSQDQDLSEVAKEIRSVAKYQNRWIKIASAYTNTKVYGIKGTDWITISYEEYASCIDPHNYR